MRFQMKLLLTYSLFIVFLVIIIGGIFYKYSTGIFQDNAYSNISIISDKMSQQLDNVVHPLDFKTTELLSDQNALSSLAILATIDRDNLNNLIYINDAKQTIYSKLMTYSIDKNFYRVSFFNNRGDFLSSNYRANNLSGDLTKVIEKLAWKKTADEAEGKLILIPPHIDPWAVNGTKVFSVARSVQWPSSGMGYVEIQEAYSVLENILSVPQNINTKVVAVLDNGEIFYNDNIKDKALLKYYSSLAVSGNKAATVKKNIITHKDEIVVSTTSEYTGMKIVIAHDKSAVFKPLFLTVRATLAAGIIIIGVSFIYIYILSLRLTKPIRQLKEKIENTELVNLPEEITFESSLNEFVSLNNSFQRLRERLNDSVEREIKAQSLQMNANFDSLQAQINPHFIYNILNVLSNKGIETGDDEICEICDSIAAMLRYSTSTIKRSANIEEEIDHARNYLVLMKKRYEHRLEFDFDIEEVIYNETIPKMVLQPIVENSVNLNFEMGIKVVKINIKGYVRDGRWFIEIMDNGKGFTKEALNELEKKMKIMRNQIINGEPKVGLSIGGMGLINTYARLLLFYDNEFIFSLKNSTSGGAQVTIGSFISNPEEEIK